MRRSTYSILKIVLWGVVNIPLFGFNTHTFYALYFSRGKRLVKRHKGLPVSNYLNRRRCYYVNEQYRDSTLRKSRFQSIQLADYRFLKRNVNISLKNTGIAQVIKTPNKKFYPVWRRVLKTFKIRNYRGIMTF